tara:strand:+ start:1430 stop:3310 length:1881 start_codon:yes stop_codon:yes gene_type:complete
MNILDQEDMIKGLDDRRLQDEAKRPSGNVPQFLVVSEIQRRSEMRKKFAGSNQQQPQGTVADQITQEGIASVPPTPMQGQPMPMRGGGMTPFMRKYAGGGVVRMQEGGITPNEMLQMDAQIMAQKYPFLSGSRDEILQGLSGIDPNDAGSISSMFGGAPEIDGVLQQVSNRNNLMSQDLSGGLGPAPMVENITPQSLLTLDGVNTLTPDGRRPNPNEPSVDTLDSFANAFREDAARAENLLATLDDSTAKEKEAISNPVNVNLPQIRTLEEIALDAPQMTPLASRSNPLPKAKKEYSSMPDGVNNALLRSQGFGDREMSTSLADSLTAGNFGSPYETGQTIRASGQQFMDVANVPIKGLYNATADATGGIRNLLSGVFGGKESGGDEFRFDTMSKFSDSKSSDATSSDPERTGTARSLIDFSEQQGSPSRQQLIANSQSVKPPVAQDKSPVAISASDGANSEGSGNKSAKGASNSASIMDRVLGLNLDGAQKEAYAMAMIQLGAGIAKGDLAEGLSNAGVAASGVLEKSRDRAGKQMDREIQQKYYDAKLDDAQQAQNFRMQQAVEKALTDWQVANISATPEEVRLKREELLKQFQVLGDTTATGGNISGGNQRSSANIDFNSLNT